MELSSDLFRELSPILNKPKSLNGQDDNDSSQVIAVEAFAQTISQLDSILVIIFIPLTVPAFHQASVMAIHSIRLDSIRAVNTVGLDSIRAVDSIGLHTIRAV